MSHVWARTDWNATRHGYPSLKALLRGRGGYWSRAWFSVPAATAVEIGCCGQINCQSITAAQMDMDKAVVRAQQ